MSFFCINGSIQPHSEAAIAASINHFDIEQSIFETIRIVRGNIPLLQYHLQRVRSSMKYFNSPFPETELEEIFSNILILCDKNNLSEKARVRLNIFYNRGSNPLGYLIETFDTPALSLEIFDQGFRVDVFYNKYENLNNKPTHHFKSKSIKINILAAQMAREAGIDDYIICTDDGEVIESSIANVFVVKNEVVYTTNNGVDGVMKTFLMDKFREDGIEVVEININLDFIKNADELFLTNALRGIIPIYDFLEKTFAANFSKAAFKKYIVPIYS